MIYCSENQIKNVLGINNWRNLLNDKMILFTSMMPKMDSSVMIDLLGQLPQFWLFSKDMLRLLEQQSPISPETLQARQLLEMKRLLDRDFDTEHNKPELKQLYFGLVYDMAEYYFSKGQLTENDRKFITALRDLQDCNTRTMLIATLSYIGGQLHRQAG
jgi:hypothetical protein